MKTGTTSVRTKKFTLPPNSFTVGDAVYPMSQFADVIAAQAKGTTLPPSKFKTSATDTKQRHD